MKQASCLSVLVLLLAGSTTADAEPRFVKRVKSFVRDLTKPHPPSMTHPASAAGAFRRNIGRFYSDPNLAGVRVRTLDGEAHGVPRTRAQPLSDLVQGYKKNLHATGVPTVATGFGSAVVTRLLGGDPNAGLFYGMIGGLFLEPFFAVPGKTAKALRPHIALATIARHPKSARTADLKWALREALSQKSAVTIARKSAQQAIRQETDTGHRLRTRDYQARRKRKRVESHLRDEQTSGRHPMLKAARAELPNLGALEAKLGSFATTIGAELDRRERQFTSP
jgi:hypothetical protein